MSLRNILIIDDDSLTISSMLRFFSGRDFNVLATNAPEVVVSSINPYGFDVIITDYKMEPLNGIELIRHLRDTGFSGRIILFSAIYVLSPAEREELKIDAFFEKPFEIEIIYKQIIEWID
ncbi:MAG: response regulator [Nitrospirae bacterium]|nr:response regulator [Nitrospirota bacterium]